MFRIIRSVASKNPNGFQIISKQPVPKNFISTSLLTRNFTQIPQPPKPQNPTGLSSNTVQPENKTDRTTYKPEIQGKENGQRSKKSKHFWIVSAVALLSVLGVYLQKMQEKKKR
jgi:hypothetical protein